MVMVALLQVLVTKIDTNYSIGRSKVFIICVFEGKWSLFCHQTYVGKSIS